MRDSLSAKPIGNRRPFLTTSWRAPSRRTSHTSRSLAPSPFSSSSSSFSFRRRNRRIRAVMRFLREKVKYRIFERAYSLLPPALGAPFVDGPILKERSSSRPTSVPFAFVRSSAAPQFLHVRSSSPTSLSLEARLSAGPRLHDRPARSALS